jgi:DNA mismatch endonuclease (patch repair protein)
LLSDGWRILTIWECALKGKHKRPLEDIIETVAQWILAADPSVPQLVVRHS